MDAFPVLDVLSHPMGGLHGNGGRTEGIVGLQTAQTVGPGGKGSAEAGAAGKESFKSLLAEVQAKAEAPPGPAAQDAQGKWVTHTVQKGDTLWALAVKKYHVQLDALIKDNAIDDPRRLQIGQELRIRAEEPASSEEVVASWYGKEYHGKPMANGVPFNMHKATIAHRTLPLGTRVELVNPSTGARVMAEVTDRGPFIKGRDVDLSYALARRLSVLDKGVGKLKMRVVG